MGEIENGPQVGQTVFYGGSGQRDARLCLELLDLSRLLGARILDRLGFVDNGNAPWDGAQYRLAQQRAKAGDDEIGVRKPRGVQRTQFGRRHDRRMGDQEAQAGGKALGLCRPVGQQRCGGDQQAGPHLGAFALQHEQQREYLHGLA